MISLLFTIKHLKRHYFLTSDFHHLLLKVMSHITFQSFHLTLLNHLNLMIQILSFVSIIWVLFFTKISTITLLILIHYILNCYCISISICRFIQLGNISTKYHNRCKIRLHVAASDQLTATLSNDIKQYANI